MELIEILPVITTEEIMKTLGVGAMDADRMAAILKEMAFEPENSVLAIENAHVIAKAVHTWGFKYVWIVLRKHCYVTVVETWGGNRAIFDIVPMPSH